MSALTRCLMCFVAAAIVVQANRWSRAAEFGMGHIAKTRTLPTEDANVPAVVALGLETLADGASEWAMAQQAGAADASQAPAAKHGIADSRLLRGGEPLATSSGVTAATDDETSTARLKSFMAARPGAPIDKVTLKWLVEATPIVGAAAAAFGKPDPTNPVAPPPAGGPGLDAVASSAVYATDAAVRSAPTTVRAVMETSITAPATRPVAPPASPPADAAAADPGPTAMLSNELLAQLMMSKLDKHEEPASRRHLARPVKAGVN